MIALFGLFLITIWFTTMRPSPSKLSSHTKEAAAGVWGRLLATYLSLFRGTGVSGFSG